MSGKPKLLRLDYETQGYEVISSMNTTWSFADDGSDDKVDISKVKHPISRQDKLLLSKVKGKSKFHVLFIYSGVRELKRLKRLGIFGDELTLF